MRSGRFALATNFLRLLVRVLNVRIIGDNNFLRFLATCPEYQKNKKYNFSAAVRKKKAKKLRRIFAVGFSAATNLASAKLTLPYLT